MNIKFKNKNINITLPKVVYALLILFFVMYLIFDMQYNTAFVDEAIYATVGEEILRKIYWESAISWMGGSYLYPIISGFINRYYGLEGIRTFSLFCVLTTGIIAGKISRQLKGKYTEVITIGLFLFSAITLNLGQLGTYDAPSLLFMALSIYVAIHSRYQKSWKKAGYIVASSILITLSVLSKYIAIFIIPVSGLLIFAKGKSIKEFFLNIFSDIKYAILWLIPSTTILTLYYLKFSKELITFFTGTNFSEPAKLVRILNDIAASTNIVAILAFSAFLYALIKVKGEKVWFAFILLIGGLTPITYHLLALNIRSMPKHLVFSLFFWTPLAGWILNKIIYQAKQFHKRNVYLSNLTNLTITIFFVSVSSFFWNSFTKHWVFQRSWPSASKTLEYLSENRKKGDKIFAEASTVYKFHLFAGFDDPSTWPSTWYMEYNGESGSEAMKKAIADQQFDYIILNDYFTSEINREIIPTIDVYYDLVLEDSYKVSGQYDQITRVWKPKENVALINTSVN